MTSAETVGTISIGVMRISFLFHRHRPVMDDVGCGIVVCGDFDDVTILL
jgi:hypothetical protein